MLTEQNRFVRQAELVPADNLAEVTATVIGVGAIGRQVALQLASIGVRRLRLIDFDTIEPSNVTTQGYWHSDVGQAKVHATAAAIAHIDPEVIVHVIQDRFRPSKNVSSAIFCCVDTISARESIWRAVGNECEFWADGRMLGEVIRIVIAADSASRRHYPETLFAANEAQRGSCTSQSTIYCAAVAAGLLLHQFTRWLRQLPIDQDLSLNLLASELVAS